MGGRVSGGVVCAVSADWETALNDYIPTTDEIRRGYIGEPAHWMDERVGEEFDRWLAAHDAELIGEMKERNPIPELEG